MLTKQLLERKEKDGKVNRGHEGARIPWVAGPALIRIQKMGSTDDPEAYLHTFERVAIFAGWLKQQWTLILIPCLTGVL